MPDTALTSTDGSPALIAPAGMYHESHDAQSSDPRPPAGKSPATVPPPSETAGAMPRDPLAPAQTTVLELRVRNHPGTMSHITGLFARRAFNLEAIVCVPVGDRSISRILLLVAADQRLEQVERQLEKLHDVLAVRHRPDLTADYFHSLAPAP